MRSYTMRYYNPDYPNIIVESFGSYIHPVTGVQYPKNWDKSKIEGLIEYPEPPVIVAEPTEDDLKNSRNNDRKNKIEELERKQTLRMMRDAILGVQEDIDMLTALQNEIAAIRSTLEA